MKLLISLSSGVLTVAQALEVLGKASFSALIRHPWYRQYVSPWTSQAPAVFLIDNSPPLLKVSIVAPTQPDTMVKFVISVTGRKVSNAHLYHWDGQRREGQKVWTYVKSFLNQE